MKGSRPLTRQQVKGLLALTDTIREQTLLKLCFCTGYRISALLSLKVADVSTNGIMGVMSCLIFKKCELCHIFDIFFLI
jgi:integrase